MTIIIAKLDITRASQGKMADTLSASVVSTTPYLRKAIMEIKDGVCVGRFRSGRFCNDLRCAYIVEDVLYRAKNLPG
jgi:hypothetical protein